ncbi:CU044_2847 family protein [Actinoplanes sp. NPDC026670]|uniref:CU044_2847 family protein n=1 Tax=Actinoplanes sp. NPDC026670 TaxID=3154700 RepID=UPI0033F42403
MVACRLYRPKPNLTSTMIDWECAVLEDRAVTEPTAIIPIQAGQDRVYLSVQRIDQVSGDEQEISARIPSFDEVVAKVTGLAGSAIDGLRNSGADRVTLEFGCEFGLESGQLITLISKATGKATFKIGLEWSAPTTH